MIIVKAQQQQKMTEKPEELVKAIEAIKNACKAVNSDFGADPLGEKPASLKGTVTKTMIYDMVKELYSAVNNITDYLANIGHTAVDTKDELKKLDDRVLDLESDKDALAQKWKVGSIIFSSNPKSNNALVKAEKSVAEADLGAHAIDLVKKKTGVDIVEGDLSKLHFVPGGGLKLKFKDLKQGSKFRKVVQAIKKPSPEQKALNLFGNFELTKSRNNLLYEVRSAVRAGRLAKYFVDFTGEISILSNLDDKPKDQIKLTRLSEVADANFNRSTIGKQPARTWSAAKFRQWLKERK